MWAIEAARLFDGERVMSGAKHAAKVRECGHVRR